MADDKAALPGLRRELGVWSAASIVVGTVIGSGIFLVPKKMIASVGSPEVVFAVWIVGGLLSLFGALTYAELAAAMPEAGGEYVYLREAYGPLWGFLYGWTQMLGGQERLDRHAGHRVLLLPGEFPARARRRLSTRSGCRSGPKADRWRCVTASCWP